MIGTHLDALLLAVASSSDNFMVGISVGLSSSAAYSTTSFHYFSKVNLVVALCNASGTFLATYSGEYLRQFPQHALQTLAAAVSSSSSPETYVANYSFESLLAAVAFAYLAWKEYREDDNDDYDLVDEKNKKSRNGGGLSYSIALPMTLNNLAGGVAGGVLGISVVQNTLYAFLVSFVSMALGYGLARRIVEVQMKRNQSSSVHGRNNASTTKWCNQVSTFIYIVLCLQSLLQI